MISDQKLPISYVALTKEINHMMILIVLKEYIHKLILLNKMESYYHLDI